MSARQQQIADIARAFLAELQASGSAFDAAAKRLTEAIRLSGREPRRPIVCVAHIQPDADALGSALAMAHAVSRAAGHAVVSFDPGPLPFGLPSALAFLPGAELLVAAKQLPARPALVVVFDTGSSGRLGQLEAYATGSPSLVVDHHAQGVAFGDGRLIDTAAAATCEIVADLIDELGVGFDRTIATCLYAGLAADTGSFRYAATTARSHQLAGRLLDARVPHDRISTALWDTRPASYLSVLQTALGRVRRDGELIWTAITATDLADAGATVEESEGVIDVIRVVPDHDVAVVLKEDVAAPGGWKVSVRSRGARDVGAACAALGGGGHRLAAGFSATGHPEQIIASLREALGAVGVLAAG